MLRVYLVPGFFGFANVGEMRYFEHVQPALRAALVNQAVAHEVHDVHTLPTASLERRAARLVETIAQTASLEDELAIVGHSTGGVDAWLMCSPGQELPTDVDVEAWAQRVRAVVSLAAPHHGAPIALAMQDGRGEELLRVLSVATVHLIRLRAGAPAPLFKLVKAVARAGSIAKLEDGLLRQVWREVLADFPPDRRKELEVFFKEVWKDRSLLAQLTPAGMQEVVRRTSQRPGVRYGAVVLQASQPPLVPRPMHAAPAALAHLGLHRLLNGLAGRWDPAIVPPAPTPAVREALRRAFGEAPPLGANDVIVPTRSQVRGEVIHAVRADHLDALGWFRDPSRDPPHVDWIRTGSRFDRHDFEALWGRVASFITGSLSGESAGG